MQLLYMSKINQNATSEAGAAAATVTELEPHATSPAMPASATAASLAAVADAGMFALNGTDESV